MTSPLTFLDPSIFPVKFIQKLPPPIFAFGESSFPVSFSFNQSPRKAVFLDAVATQLDTFFVDRNIYSSSSVVQLGLGESKKISLIAQGSDIGSALFFLSISAPNQTPMVISSYNTMRIRQPLFSAEVEHHFATDLTAKTFNPVLSSGDLYYPVAVLQITTHQIMSGGNRDLDPVITSKDEETNLALAPKNEWGISDVEIDVVLQWYEDQARTILTHSPKDFTMPRFGLRLYASNASKFSEKIIVNGGSCVATALYPTTVLRQLGGNDVSLYYWGGGDDKNGLFWGKANHIEVSKNGIAIQDDNEVSPYILENKLLDYDFSSSSSSSTSSVNSSSSSSSQLNTTSLTSLSTVSHSSYSTWSSSSTSSKSSSSSSTSSFSSLTSFSDVSSLSSTELLDLSSSSSVLDNVLMSSSSSLIADIVFKHGFSAAPGGDRSVTDESGNGNNFKLGPATGLIGSPIWGEDYGIEGGGFKFVSDVNRTTYLEALNPQWVTSFKTISFWMKTQKAWNRSGVVFCISNGFESIKTEFAIQVNALASRIESWVIIDGNMQWHVKTNDSSISLNSWLHIAVKHNGYEPIIYIDGAVATLDYLESNNKSAWTAGLLSATLPVDRSIIGGSPRNYPPFMTLGFFGQLDEIIMWDVPLSQAAIEEEMLKMSTLSSQSFSSQS